MDETYLNQKKEQGKSMVFRKIAFWFAVAGVLLLPIYWWWNFVYYPQWTGLEVDGVSGLWNFWSLKEEGLSQPELTRRIVNFVINILRFVFSNIGVVFGAFSFSQPAGRNWRGIAGMLVNNLLFMILVGEWLWGMGYLNF
jgi:hypothetical protein